MSATLLTAEAARFKAAERVKTDRVLEFYAAAFTPGTPDAYGDVIDPHAFDEWLGSFYAKGQSLRISFNHAAVLDSLDPTNVVGYAPASPTHVWVDDYGLRVKAFLDVTSEKGKAVEYQVEKGLLTGASLAYSYDAKDRVKAKGHFILKRIYDVTEAGLVPNPANQSAVLLWLKSEGALEQEADLPYMTVEEFRSVLGLEEPAPDLKGADEPAKEKAMQEQEGEDLAVLEEAVEAVKHAHSASHIQKAHDALVRSGAKCAGVEEFVAAAQKEQKAAADDVVAARLRNLRHIELSTI